MISAYRFGPVREGDFVRFRLWAPSGGKIAVELRDSVTVALEDREDGWKETSLRCGPGTRYRFREGGLVFPDPASRLQDGGPHGWSVVCEPVTDPSSWKGRPWSETVLYELHVGLFGGFDGVARALPELSEIGITAIELMPIAAFPGRHNWGYDGVLPFAPAESYGSPDALRTLIARAHELDMTVLLDVVYNHFGPDGNYLPLYAKNFFRDDVATPWGAAIDFRDPLVRRFFTENALYWIHEFGFDGLRFDAVHAIAGNGWLCDLADEVRASAARDIHLILENDDNDVRLLRGGFDAQWNDDFHHAAHVLLTGEHSGYYSDFADAPASGLARALKEGFIYQGQPSASHGGKARGSPSAELPPTSFVDFLQNHDQIGNRALGERLTVLANSDALKAAIALLLLSPQIPMIFMGEEVGSRAPFFYFTDHDEKLAAIVREGRRREFGALLESDGELPDPNAPSSFERSNPFTDAPDRNAWRDFYRHLLMLRRANIMPHLDDTMALDANALTEHAVLARWKLGNGCILTIACNLGEEKVEAAFPSTPALWGAAQGNVLPSRTTLAWIEAP
jgi:maltooligosyltrehalose trehalohydrolase